MVDGEICEPAQCGVYSLQRHTACPHLDPGLTVDLCIDNFHSELVGNKRQVRVLTKRFALPTL